VELVPSLAIALQSNKIAGEGTGSTFPTASARLNIALVILHADPAKGGAETYTVDLARALCDRGHAVSMLAASLVESLDPRIERVRLAFRGPTRLWRYRRFLFALDEILHERKFDVVHAMLPVRRCDLYHPHAGIAAEAVATGHRKHITPIGRAAAQLANAVNRKRQFFAAVERRLLLHESPPAGQKNPPLVICLSDYIKTSVRRFYPLPDEQLVTLINAVDLAKFEPNAAKTSGREVRDRFGIRENQVVALIVAQDFARKGLREAIEAWRMVNDERLVLMVVGKDHFAPYAKLVENAPFAKNVIYAGATRDVRPFYAAADCFVLPTRHDPCSLVVLEALAMGLPVISTKFNGACEVMTERVHGFVLPDPEDVAALADALRKMLDDSARKTMHEACLALRPRLAYEHHLDQLMGFYERSVARR
jgi:UDP-glucose:(heptosyl)LPS alpha-1,3-glucosyltransferase